MAHPRKTKHKKSKDIRSVFKFGGSLAITIPKEYAEQHGLKPGSEMEILFNNVLLGQPVTEERVDREALELMKKAGYPIKA